MRYAVYMRSAALLASLVAIAGCGGDELHLGSTASAIDISLFELPSLSAEERARIVRKHDALDPADLVPRGLLEDALLYLETNAAHIPRKAYVVVVDLSLFSGKDRFWLVDLSSGAVEGHKVAHGSGSDPDHDGYATLFGNTPGSHMSSLGFALTAEIYDGKYPHSMRLDGISPDGSPNGMANTNLRSRLIVVHAASYVDDDNTEKQGRSEGCFAIDSAIAPGVVDRIHDGSLLYAARSALNEPVGRSVCGDGTCDWSEIDSCPADCQVVIADAGGIDAGSIDAGSVDAGSIDAGARASNAVGGCAVGGGSPPAGAGLLVSILWFARRPRRRDGRAGRRRVCGGLGSVTEQVGQLRLSRRTAGKACRRRATRR